MPDHIHVLLSVSSKFSIAMTTGYLKVEKLIRLRRQFLTTQKGVLGRRFCTGDHLAKTEEPVKRTFINKSRNKNINGSTRYD